METGTPANGVSAEAPVVETPAAPKGGRKAAKAVAPARDPIVQVNVLATVVGISPLLLHPMDAETLMGLVNREKGSSAAKGNAAPPIFDTAAGRMYRDEATGRICIPSQNLFAALIEAGRRIPYANKSMLSNADASKLPGILSINEENLLLEPNPEPNGPDTAPEDLGWVPDLRRGVMGPSKITVPIIRPKFPVWGFDISFTLDLEGEPVGEEQIRRCFDIAGKSVGLCSFRPACKGTFGRFRVKEWVAQRYTRAQLDASLATAK